MSSSIASRTKDEWRRQFRAYRNRLSPTVRQAKSALICTRVSALPSVARASVVHVYWPLPDRGEVDTRPLIELLHSRGATVVLPVVTSYDPATPTLEHRRYEGRAALTPNRWGIPEPTDTERVPPDALDVVIVPGLGADHCGNRIGQGSGYYDAFLRTVDVPRVLVTYDECFVPFLPTEAHDVPMTAVVTERGTTPISTAYS